MGGLPRLVDASCEVGDRLCQDILCLVRWVSARHTVGPSGARDRPGMEERGGHGAWTGCILLLDVK
jgi:hypothetical protein